MINNLPTEKDFEKLFTTTGKFAFQKMFWEFGSVDSRKKLPPVFTLKMRPHLGLPSAYQVYMDSIDEYDAAAKLAPNMKVWDDLTAAAWFLKGDTVHAHEGLEVWREHMRLRDQSLAKGLLIEQTKGGNTTAASKLYNESKATTGAGRRSKKNTTEVPKSTVSRIKDFNKKQGK